MIEWTPGVVLCVCFGAAGLVYVLASFIAVLFPSKRTNRAPSEGRSFSDLQEQVMLEWERRHDREMNSALVECGMPPWEPWLDGDPGMEDLPEPTTESDYAPGFWGPPLELGPARNTRPGSSMRAARPPIIECQMSDGTTFHGDPRRICTDTYWE